MYYIYLYCTHHSVYIKAVTCINLTTEHNIQSYFAHIQSLFSLPLLILSLCFLSLFLFSTICMFQLPSPSHVHAHLANAPKYAFIFLSALLAPLLTLPTKDKANIANAKSTFMELSLIYGVFLIFGKTTSVKDIFISFR